MFIYYHVLCCVFPKILYCDEDRDCSHYFLVNCKLIGNLPQQKWRKTDVQSRASLCEGVEYTQLSNTGHSFKDFLDGGQRIGEVRRISECEKCGDIHDNGCHADRKPQGFSVSVLSPSSCRAVSVSPPLLARGTALLWTQLRLKEPQAFVITDPLVLWGCQVPVKVTLSHPPQLDRGQKIYWVWDKIRAGRGHSLISVMGKTNSRKLV